MTDLKTRARTANGSNGAAGTDVERQSTGPTLSQQIKTMEHQFALAAPRGMEAAQLVRDALTCLRQTPKLAECEPSSVLGALMTCAQLGLRPGVLGHAWVLPYWDGKARRFNAQLIIGYQGLVDLAHRSGKIASLVARAVHSNDHFEIAYGLADTLVHRPAMTGPRGDVTGYYAVVKLTTGGAAFWYMTKDEMLAWRDKYAPKNRDGAVVGPWKSDFDAMGMKGLALDTPIPTPSGWSTMGGLRIGDQVFDMHGQQCAVAAKSEVKALDCYRVTFGNGSSIVCDQEHLWLAGIGTNAARDVRTSGWAVHEVTDLYAAKQAGQRVVMPVSRQIETEPGDLLVDPWLLGYWLGDGCSANARLSVHADHLDDVTRGIEAAGYTVGGISTDKRSNSAMTVGVRGGLAKDLAELGVLGFKHVPRQYLRASATQRLALLRGLIDSDGCIDSERGRATFVNTNRELVDAVAELARSLGEMVHIRQSEHNGFGVTATAWTVAWRPSICPATIGAKVERFRPRLVAPYRVVKSIERVPTVPTQCIAVDSPTRTYLAGVDMVPTHNTCVRQLAKWMPKSTELAVALAADESVRVDITPDRDAAETSYQVSGDEVTGEIVEDTPAPTSDAQGEDFDPTLDPNWGAK